MMSLKNSRFTVAMDERYPRVLYFEDKAGARIRGHCQAIAPRVHLYRKSDNAYLTSDEGEVEVVYTCQGDAKHVIYTGSVNCDGRLAAQFEMLFQLDGQDMTVRLQNVREQAGYLLLSVRLHALISALSDEGDSRAVTCMAQGRVLDPKVCQAGLLDISWVAYSARVCGAVYKPSLMVTIDIPGYEDIMVHDVRQYSRIGGGRTIVSLGGEMMYRQRPVEGLEPVIKINPPASRMPKKLERSDPILCSEDPKEIRLHLISASKGKKLDWPDAAKHFQAQVPAKIVCNPLYENTLVYKICMAHIRHPYMTFDQALDIIKQVHNISGGMKQVCYLAYFQNDGGETGFPEMWKIYPPLGDKAMLRRLMTEARKYNAIVSFHQNMDVFDAEGETLDARYIARDSLGRLYSAGYWHPTQLLQIAMPEYRQQFRKHIARLVKEYGIEKTYHLDVFSCTPYTYDANPDRPYSAKKFTEGKLKILEDFNAHGIDVTSEGLTHPYVGRIGHVWVLFNWLKFWEGEQAVPFGNYIYHGAISWNSGTGKDEQAILQSLVQGGGVGLEWPMGTFNPQEARYEVVPTPWDQVADGFYLVQHPYMMLRSRRWSDMITDGSKRRVEYGKGSYIEVDDEKKIYEVVVDGQLIAKDFVTVVQAPDGKGMVAYARQATELKWPAPKEWSNGPLKATTLTTSGPGLLIPDAAVKAGKITLKLPAQTPVRLERL